MKNKVEYSRVGGLGSYRKLSPTRQGEFGCFTSSISFDFSSPYSYSCSYCCCYNNSSIYSLIFPSSTPLFFFFTLALAVALSLSSTPFSISSAATLFYSSLLLMIFVTTFFYLLCFFTLLFSNSNTFSPPLFKTLSHYFFSNPFYHLLSNTFSLPLFKHRCCVLDPSVDIMNTYLPYCVFLMLTWGPLIWPGPILPTQL